jgi:hypothetical protein
MHTPGMLGVREALTQAGRKRRAVAAGVVTGLGEMLNSRRNDDLDLRVRPRASPRWAPNLKLALV